MPYPLPLTRTEAYLAYKAGVIQQSDLKPSLSIPRNGIDAWLAYWTGLAADYPKREDGTPYILQEEEAYIAYLCGVINEYPEKCLRRVGAYLRYLISARWGRPDHPLNREELYLSLIKTQFIPSGDPSSDITIDGTAKAPFVDVKMYGDTYQQSYTGKNLVGFPTGNFTKDGLTFTFAEDGTITIDGTRTGTGASFYNRTTLLSLIAGNFRLAIIPISGDYSGASLGIRGWNGSTQSFYSARSSGGEYGGAGSLTQEQVDTTIAIDVLIGSGTAVFDEFKFKLQVTAGTERDTDYEPYCGGVPSPNPDYPQAIQTVTGEQTVDVQGKNLNRFPYASGSSRTHRGVTFTANPDGSVTIKGTHDGSGTAIYYFRDFWAYNETDGVVLDANTTITASITGGAKYGIRFIAEGYHSDGTYDQLSTTSAQTITTTAKATFNGRITVYNGFSSTEGITVYPMIETGSTATAYAPYSKQTYPIDLGTIELCKLGDDGDGNPLYKDRIYRDGDEWKIHKETGKVALSSITWETYAYTLKRSGANPIADMAYVENNQQVGVGLTDGFKIRKGSGLSSESLLGYFAIDANRIAFNVGIDGNNPSGSLYYALATPTDTIITNQALIDQLEALKNGGAENGTTYIKVNATDPNLPGLLYVEAPKYE